MVRSDTVTMGSPSTADLAQVTVVTVAGAGLGGWQVPPPGIREGYGSVGGVVAVAVLVGAYVDNLRVAALVGLLALLVEWRAARRSVFVTDVRVPIAALHQAAAWFPQDGQRAQGPGMDVPSPRHSREG
ncbi:hypothetical protein [Micromonospora sp. NPDC051296]|uniref:hypothetical protein n=1 Tax=Micromonospora sp. NPDC051296 TaxID=3155046 RepID=UPI00344A4FE1